MSKEEVAKRVEQSLDLFEQGELIDIVAFGEDVRSLVTQAAANKATEEGELPALPEPYGLLEFESEIPGDLRTVAGYCADDMKEYARQAISADRASRQVANKAEVDLSSLQRYDIMGDYEGGQMMTESDVGDWVYFADVKSIATPPATTGASTALRPTDDDLWDATLRDRDAYHEWADKLADAIAKHFGVDIGEHSNQNLPWDEALQAIENAEPVGASTVLTDERILRISEETALNYVTDERRPDNATIIDFAREIEREIKSAGAASFAAQAGQVAVPEWVSVDDRRKPEPGQQILLHVRTLHRGEMDGQELTAEGAEIAMGEYAIAPLDWEDPCFFQCYTSPISDNDWITHWMPLPAAPSPAKESK